eukprot:CAMPEP_0183821194 /NCGR_PEP_ID=MMETSP0803_2-20130417/65015_1 /TAXON_ID=195967 /ORGANISM="Crustomastix stigmata, Strain CCMP3273" /LENGTH=381 /DNA_ID=CAMNT_0026066091 /DNA_START=543 /DNA_END=1691 /DNA_ORIENTATION=+
MTAYEYSIVGKCWSNEQYATVFRRGMQDAGIDAPKLQNCFWSIDMLQYTMMCTILILTVNTAVTSCDEMPTLAYFVAMVGSITTTQILYGRYMPNAYRKANDGEKMVFRLVLHTVAMEIASLPGRKGAQFCLRGGHATFLQFCFMGERFGSLYSRLLVNSVTDTTLIAVSAVVLSIIEISMRLTVFQRDAFIAKIAQKITGQPGDVLKGENAKMFRKQLIILQSTCELCDVIVMGCFFALVLQPDGPLSYSQMPSINRKALVSVGFKIEQYIMKNVAIQMAVEIMTDGLLVVLESQLGIDAITLLDVYTNQTFVFKYATTFILFGFFYTYSFTVLLFMFPILNVYDLQYSSFSFFDLEGTWIYYMPDKVEVTYANEFMKSL